MLWHDDGPEPGSLLELVLDGRDVSGSELRRYVGALLDISDADASAVAVLVARELEVLRLEETVSGAVGRQFVSGFEP